MNKLQIGAWYPVDLNYLDKRHIDEMAEAGIDFIFAAWGDEVQKKEIFRLCADAKIGVLTQDMRVLRSEGDSEKIFAYTGDYINEPAFIGNMLRDEPPATDYPGYAKLVDGYKKARPDKVPYINLLPIYASKEMLGTETYEEYIEQYAAQIDTDYISVDIYPFSCGNDGIKRTNNDYFRNLDITAEVCRRYGRSLRGFIQTMGFNYIMRDPTEPEMRYQAYAFLAFGADAIYHFCYATPPSSGEHFEYAMIDLKGEKTHLWHSAKAVNDELHAISDVLSQYINVGTYINIAGEKPDGVDFDNIYDINSLGTVKSFESDETVLAGCFKKESGKGDALILLNASEIRDEKTAEVKLSLCCEKTVTAYPDGKAERIYPDSDGIYTFALECCRGYLVTIE